MSSHHIVRDEQEPALFVRFLENRSVQNLRQLLEWSPTVLCDEPAILSYVELGHKLDVAIVQTERAAYWRQQLADQFPLKILALPDSRSLEAGLTYLQHAGHRAVNVLTNEAEVKELLKELFRWLAILDIVILSESCKYLLIRGMEFKKWVPAGTELRVKTVTDQAEWQINGDVFKGEELTLSRNQEGEVVILCDSAPFMVIEKWSAEEGELPRFD